MLFMYQGNSVAPRSELGRISDHAIQKIQRFRTLMRLARHTQQARNKRRGITFPRSQEMRTLILWSMCFLGLSALSRGPRNFHRGPWSLGAACGYHFLGQHPGYGNVSWLWFASLYENASKSQKFSHFLSRDIPMRACLAHRLPMIMGEAPFVFLSVQYKICRFTFRFSCSNTTSYLSSEHQAQGTNPVFYAWSVVSDAHKRFILSIRNVYQRIHVSHFYETCDIVIFYMHMHECVSGAYI